MRIKLPTGLVQPTITRNLRSFIDIKGGEALVRAAKRGVRLTVIVETPDKIAGEDEYSTIKALGQEVAACSTVRWTPKTGPGNKVVFPRFIFEGRECQGSESPTV